MENAGEGELKEKSKAKHGFGFYFQAAEIVLVILLILSVVGVGISDFSQKYGFYFWLAMAPLFCLASLAISWSRAHRRGESWYFFLGRQFLHWGALMLALGILYLFQRTGRFANVDAGLVAMLLLSLTTFLAGVHFDWRFYVIGIFLAGATVAIAFVEQFFWILLIPALLVFGFLIFRLANLGDKKIKQGRKYD